MKAKEMGISDAALQHYREQAKNLVALMKGESPYADTFSGGKSKGNRDEES